MSTPEQNHRHFFVIVIKDENRDKLTYRCMYESAAVRADTMICPPPGPFFRHDLQQRDAADERGHDTPVR